MRKSGIGDNVKCIFNLSNRGMPVHNLNLPTPVADNQSISSQFGITVNLPLSCPIDQARYSPDSSFTG